MKHAFKFWKFTFDCIIKLYEAGISFYAFRNPLLSNVKGKKKENIDLKWVRLIFNNIL